MSKIYAIKLDNGNLHKNNLGEIVYFSNKYNARDYMKCNHYDGVIQPLYIDLEKDKKIADLEAKLAESKNDYLLLEEQLENANEWSKYFQKENKQLKQQLAAKDLEIKNLTLAHFESETNKPVLTTTQIINQDKISFAVEQLSKAKFDALMLGGVVQGETFFINSEHYRNYIDIQIEELKKEMK